MASGQPSKGTDLRKGNPTSLSVNTTNVRGVKTSIPDLISEEENQVEDDEVDVIRLAQHRPYLQQHLRQPILENKWRRNSGNTDPASTNTGANIASIRSESAPAASAGPTKRRRLLVAVLIPPVKRRINEKPGSSPALGYEESQQPTGSTAAHAQWPSTKKASRLHNQRQKTKPEREREIVTWDRNHRRKARISDDTSSTSSTPSASPAVSPAPSEGSIDSSDRPLSASVKMATGPDFLGPDLLSHKVIPSDGIPSSKGKKDTAENVAEPEDNTRSTRESTPGEGDLGSSSVRYRRYVISRAQKHPQKSSASTSVASRASDNMALPELLRRITPLLRGGSISSASSIDSLVELMSNVDEAGGRKIILNALLSTQSSVILGRFIRSEGLGILRQWIGDARNNPDSPQQQEILQAIIRVLKALPFDVKTLKGNLKGAIALIAGDGDRNHASSNDLSFSQSTAAQKISQLPRFKLRSPTTSNQSQLPSPVLASTQKDHPVKEEDTQIRHDLSSAPPNRAAASPSRPPTTINFDPLSSQHNKAMEALRKQQKKPKRVQFKDDAELVSIRYFEKYLGGDESANADENEHTKESFDNDDSYSHPEQDSMVSIDHQSVTRQFIIPDNEAKRLIDGVAWTPPQLLYIVFEPDPDGRIQEIAHGEQSTEKYWQAERESQVQSVTYRNIVDIPASPEEPDPETEKVLPTDLASQTQIPLFSRDADHVSVLLQTLTGVYQLITRSSGHL
ncbi:hypothetical protein BGX20_009779 [Mortierella sp. AD010]|nr:hypothetical protein BGX20_009779 [Mortierella sp. AD010]